MCYFSKHLYINKGNLLVGRKLPSDDEFHLCQRKFQFPYYLKKE